MLDALDEVFYELREARSAAAAAGGSAAAGQRVASLQAKLRQLQGQADQLVVPNAFGSLLSKEVRRVARRPRVRCRMECAAGREGGLSKPNGSRIRGCNFWAASICVPQSQSKVNFRAPTGFVSHVPSLSSSLAFHPFLHPF